MTAPDFNGLLLVALLGVVSVSGEREREAEFAPQQLRNWHLQAPEDASKVEAVKAEVARFLKFPPGLRKQMLRYGRRWREGISR